MATNVSTFELLFKRLSPSNPISELGSELPLSLALQGYFLAITNLEDEAYRYRIEFISPPVTSTPSQPLRDLTGNTYIIVDIPNEDNQFGVLNQSSSDPSVYTSSRGTIRIPAQTTALVAVIPNVFPPTPFDMTPITQEAFEVRGYVRISLPSVFPTDPTGRQFFGFTVPQSENPVKVLLTPQHRTTFYSPTNEISGETQTSLPVASGGALSHIVPDEGGPTIVIINEVFDFDRIESVLSMLNTLSPEDRSDVLLGLMSQIDPDIDIKTFNATLDTNNIPFKIKSDKSVLKD